MIIDQSAPSPMVLLANAKVVFVATSPDRNPFNSGPPSSERALHVRLVISEEEADRITMCGHAVRNYRFPASQAAYGDDLGRLPFRVEPIDSSEAGLLTLSTRLHELVPLVYRGSSGIPSADGPFSARGRIFPGMFIRCGIRVFAYDTSAPSVRLPHGEVTHYRGLSTSVQAVKVMNAADCSAIRELEAMV